MDTVASVAIDPDRLVGARVLVAGAGVSGLAAAEELVAIGAEVTVTDAVPARLADLPPGAGPAPTRTRCRPGPR